jgi:hypothetical protein
MSEFSESYHLRTENSSDAVELLRRAGLNGFVYPPTGGWVSFVAEGGDFEPDERIVSVAGRVLLHYVCAEDHGWNFTLFDGAKVISRYRCDWEDEVLVASAEYDRTALLPFVAPAKSAVFEDFESRLRPADLDDVMESEPSKLLAQALGLEHYDWLDYDHLARDFHETPENYPALVEVR